MGACSPRDITSLSFVHRATWMMWYRTHPKTHGSGEGQEFLLVGDGAAGDMVTVWCVVMFIAAQPSVGSKKSSVELHCRLPSMRVMNTFLGVKCLRVHVSIGGKPLCMCSIFMLGTSRTAAARYVKSFGAQVSRGRKPICIIMHRMLFSH